MLNILVRHSLPIVISIFVLCFALIGETATSLLQFERAGVNNGEIWRLITGNFVHLSWSHALLNIAGLVLIWLLFNHYFSNTAWIIILICSLLTTTLGLLVFNLQLNWYVGLSGSLHGLFIAGCIAEIKSLPHIPVLRDTSTSCTKQKSQTGTLLLVIIVLKIIWEQYQGPLPGTAAVAGGNVIVDAHLYGAIAGLSAIVLKTASKTSLETKASNNTR